MPADLTGAKFYNKEITRVNFSGAILRYANFGSPASPESNPFPTVISETIFDDSNLDGITIDNTILQNNSFLRSSLNTDCRHMRSSSDAKLNNNCVRWTHVIFRGKNNFGGVDLLNSSWIAVQFFADENGNKTDFTDANLEGVQFTDNPVPLPDVWKILSADSAVLNNVILCRTRLTSGKSDRDCSASK